MSVRLQHAHHHGNSCLYFHLQVHLQGSDPVGSAAGQVATPVLAELLVPEAVNDRAHETRDDVDNQKEDVPDFQTQVGEEGDERRLEGRNHKGQHAEQQLQQNRKFQNISVSAQP